MVTLRPHPILLVYCLAFHMLHSLQVQAQPSYLNKSCTNTSSYIEGSQFQKNLNQLLQDLTTGAESNTPFFSNTIGNFPDVVYAIFLCKGDVPASTCQNCVVAASKEIVDKCPFRKEAIIWYDDCLIRYSNTSFLSKLEVDPRIKMSSTSNVTEKLDDMDERIRKMFDNLILEAPLNSFKGSYTNTEVNITDSSDFIKLYGVVQCTPNLTATNCSSCFSSLDPHFIESKGGVFTPSCYFWYELYLANTADHGTNEMQEKSQKVQLLELEGERLADEYSGDSFPSEKQEKSQDFPLLRLDLIRTATQHFSEENKLGQGGFGPVYKGTLSDGMEIAVKRLLRSSRQGLKEFKAEVTLIARLQHRNLVKLLGCCWEGEELLLVYDYMPNKSLDVFLVDPTKGAQLDWKIRHRIINGIARGMLYLHEDSRIKIIHRDLKSSNVLLDHEMNPKISDFGLARIVGSNQIEANTNRVVGTYGYMAPEYAMKGIFSVKSDVFSFGVLLLEIISGKKNSRFHLSGHGHNLLTFAWKLWSDGQGLELMDLLLKESYVETEVLKCIHIGLLCVQEDPANRPTMSSVVFMLGSDATTLPQPSEPAFFLGRVVPSAQPEPKDIGSSVNEVTLSNVSPR